MLSVASSSIDDSRGAIRAVFAKLDLSSLAGVLLFCSSRYALEQIATETQRYEPPCTIIGCTTAGEIGRQGFADGALIAIGFPASDFTLNATRFDQLDEFDPVGVKVTVERLVVEARAESARLGDRLHRVALLLIDGLSHREELFAHALQNCLGPTPLIGGSAGDNMAFRQTGILHKGVFRRDSAALAILTSRRSLQPFCRSYGVAGKARAIVTRADPVTRRVYELNGENAALEYARLVGVASGDLSPMVFAAHPLMVRVAGHHYARSVQSRGDDGSLVFQSAIARGLVTHVGSSQPMPAALLETLESVRSEIGPLGGVLVFDDIQNKVAAKLAGDTERLARLYAENGFVGFHSYGEQFRELHLNRSIVGVAIGAAPQ
jgi:hypothetical protein